MKTNEITWPVQTPLGGTVLLHHPTVTDSGPDPSEAFLTVLNPGGDVVITYGKIEEIETALIALGLGDLSVHALAEVLLSIEVATSPSSNPYIQKLKIKKRVYDLLGDTPVDDALVTWLVHKLDAQDFLDLSQGDQEDVLNQTNEVLQENADDRKLQARDEWY